MDRFLNLDSTTHDLLFSCLSVRDLLALSRASAGLSTSLRGYKTRAYNINHLLKRWFPSVSLIEEFRAMQARTGTAISGSAALQFFERTCYPDSDLDIYTEIKYALDMANFLVKTAGYTFKPRESQDPSYTAAIETARERVETFGDMGYDGYRHGIADVFNFTKGSQKVQMITAFMANLSVILTFHSTCVMNVITHRTAFALFPRATFLDRQSLIINPSTNTNLEEPERKYTARGWEMIYKVSTYEATHDFFDYKAGFRRVGDRKTWTIDLAPPVNASDVPEHLIINSWELEYKRSGDAANMHDVMVNGDILKFKYVVRDLPFVQDVFEAMVSPVNGQPCDDQLAAALRKFLKHKRRAIYA